MLKNKPLYIHEPDDIRTELAARSIYHFTHYTMPNYQAGWVHRVICSELQQFYEDVRDKKSPHLMVFMPPRHGKSELVSRRFPAWLFGQNPDFNIIATSYSSDLVGRMNRDVQRIIDSERYRTVFPDIGLSGKNILKKEEGSYLRNSEIFEIVNHKGSYRSAGVGGGITGMGADILIIDDPVKDAQAANSETVRESIWEWYTSTAYTRVSPGGGVLLVMTRWHEDDLAGRILKRSEHAGINWKVIKFKAIATEDDAYRKAGEALHPERYPVERLNSIHKNMGNEYYWESLYQQEPFIKEGGMFSRGWFTVVGSVPHSAKSRVRYWDRAATVAKSGKDPDWTVGVKMSKDKDGIHYIEDVVRLRAGSLDVQNMIKNTASQDGVLCRIGLEQDPGQAGKAEVEMLIRQLAGYTAHAHLVQKNKVTRAMPLSAQAEAGNIKLVNGPWIETFLKELESFPFATHDDQVDAASGAFNMLNEAGINYFHLLGDF